MAEPDWGHLKEVYAAVRRAPLEDRQRVIAELCEADSALRAEVESLLTFEDEQASILELTSDSGFADFLARGASLDVGNAPQVAGYRITRLLGRGGMGVVFEAEQENPRRTVALKVLRPHPFLDDLLPRMFQREVEALARLEHPGIAVIHEAGQTEEGWHYFAMERVRGAALHDFARQRELSLRERVEIFAKVCDAMCYAHQRGVIHRDLKPTNILVTDEGVPKVLDFGLARIMRGATGTELTTMEGQVLGTLPYMSPEQADGRSGDVDVRSDVYSLGVILYELVTGTHPYDLGSSTLLEAARIICEHPARPLRTVSPGISAELEAVVLRALEKEPDRRYPTSAALRDDVDRYLTDRPVLARPPSAAYHLRKLVARHRVVASLGALLLLVVAGSALVTGILAVRIAGERDAAVVAGQHEKAAREAEKAVSDFLVGLFGQGDPHIWSGREPSVRELMERGVARLDTELFDQPLARARLSVVLGDVSRVLGEYDRARSLLEEAVEIRRRELEADHEDLQEALSKLASLETYFSNHEAATELLAECVEMARRRDGDPSEGLARAYQALGEGRYYAGDAAAGREVFQRAADMFRETQGEDSIERASSLNDLGACLQRLGRLDEAEEVLQSALAMKRRLGDDGLSIGWTLEALAHVAHAHGDLDEAIRYLEEQVELLRESVHDLHPSLAFALNNLGSLVLQAKGADAADPYVAEALLIRRRGLGENNPSVADSLESLAVIRLERGLPDDAMDMQRQAVDIRRKVLGEEHTDVGRSLRKLGWMLSEVGALDESLEVLLESHEILARNEGEDDPETLLTVQRLVAVLEAAGDSIGAEEWRARLAGQAVESSASR